MLHWRNIRIVDAGLSGRTTNALTRDQRIRTTQAGDWRGLVTMGEVADLTDRAMRGRPGVGAKVFAEARAWIAEAVELERRGDNRDRRGGSRCTP